QHRLDQRARTTESVEAAGVHQFEQVLIKRQGRYKLRRRASRWVVSLWQDAESSRVHGVTRGQQVARAFGGDGYMVRFPADCRFEPGGCATPTPRGVAGQDRIAQVGKPRHAKATRKAAEPEGRGWLMRAHDEFWPIFANQLSQPG